MAFVSQELKARIAPKVKAVCKKYGVKGTLSVHHHSTLVFNISAGPIDFISSYNACGQGPFGDPDFVPATSSLSINEHWYKEHFDGKALAFLEEVIPLLNDGNHDNSDIQSDYFDVGWYINVKVGKWDKPYLFNKA